MVLLLDIETCPTLDLPESPFPSIQTCPYEPDSEPVGLSQVTDRPLWPLPFANWQDLQLACSPPLLRRAESPWEP